MKEDPQLEENIMEMLLDDAFYHQPSKIKENVLKDIRKRELKKRIIFFSSIAALVIIGIFIRINIGQQPIQKTFADTWEIINSKDARYTFVTPSHIKLLKGEIRIKSNESHQIKIETDNCVCVAEEGEFLIGFHQDTQEGEPKMKIQKLTRMLVLGGMLSLTASGKEVALKKHEAAVVKDNEVKKIVLKTNNDFAFKLYKELNNGTQNNTFFSPYSIMNAFAISAEGARGKTAEEMGKALSFPADLMRKGKDAQEIPWEMKKLHTGIAKLNKLLANDPNSEEIKKLKAEIAKKLDDAQYQSYWKRKEIIKEMRKLEQTLKTYKFSIVNDLWIEKTFKFNDDYINKIAKVYNSPIRPVDFRKNPDNVRDLINKQVEKDTNGKIKDLLPASSINTDTKMVITNAIHFKGDWLKSFNKKYTKEREFLSYDNTKIKVDMMTSYKSETVKYGAFDSSGNSVRMPYKYKDKTPKVPANGFEVLEMPYKGNDISMVVLLPSDAAQLKNIESKLNSENLDKWVKTLVKRKTNVYFPKFKNETSIDNFPQILKKMGMKQAFSMQADFSGIEKSKSLFIANVVHKAYIDVNESGTEAAAATAKEKELKSEKVWYDFTPTFNANRPFVYLIRDMNTGTVLFIGRMAKPSTK